MHYEVIQRHRSEYPTPITFAKGAPLFVGERYEGSQGWEDWYFCSTPGQREGWVPAQVFNMTAPGAAVAMEDYTARELDVEVGERLEGGRELGAAGLPAGSQRLTPQRLICNRVRPCSGARRAA